MTEKELLDAVIHGVLTDTLTEDIEEKYVRSSSIYDDPYGSNDPSILCWIRDGDAFNREDLCDWDSYLDKDWLVKIGFSDAQLKHWSGGNTPSDSEYRLFSKSWLTHTFKTDDFAAFPLAYIHTLKHSDGRSCIYCRVR